MLNSVHPCAPGRGSGARPRGVIDHMPTLLVVDDDPGFTSALGELLEHLGFTVTIAASVEEARAAWARGVPDGLLVDLMLPDGSGLDLIHELDTSATRVIVLTGHPSVERAVQSLRARVHDFLVKPVDLERLKACVAPLRGAQKDTDRGGTAPGDAQDSLQRIVGSSVALRSLKDSMRKVAPTEASVLLVGESGTGKELVAQIIHELSERRDGTFLAVNCGALPTELIGSELFGHEKGSFTGATRQHRGVFERANGGTLFLDEITEMPAELQVNLLRVLETGTFRRIGGDSDRSTDARLVAATNQDPEEAVKEGKLREDLYFRLTVFPLRLPPLRERREDVAALAEHFLGIFNAEQRTAKQFADGAIAALEQHSWPGNVRELRNVVQRAFILGGDRIGEQQIEEAIGLGGDFSPAASRIGVGSTISEAERHLIMATLEHYGGNKRAAAEALGISLKTLYNRLKDYQDD